MKNHIDAYKNGMSYETFMRRAFRTSDNLEHGMHCSIIENLVRVESGDTSFVDWHGSKTKQLSDAKQFMNHAMERYLKMTNIAPENLIRLKKLAIQIDSARSSDDLMNIVNQTLELTQCVKNY